MIHLKISYHFSIRNKFFNKLKHFLKIVKFLNLNFNNNFQLKIKIKYKIKFKL